MLDRHLAPCHPLQALPHLLRTADNSVMHAALSSAKHVVDIGTVAKCDIAPGYRLIQVDGRLQSGCHEVEIALINDVESSVVYYNSMMISGSIKFSEKKAVKPLIWLNPNISHAPTLRELVPRVLYGYIAEHYDVILSTDNQSGKSRYRWLRQLSNALTHGLHVYHYKLAADKLQQVSSIHELNTLQDTLWSSHYDDEHVLAVLSASPLSSITQCAR